MKNVREYKPDFVDTNFTKKVILIAHRGKGPTSKFTAPTEELWLKCQAKNLLGGYNNLIVPQKILESYNIKLPDNVPPENTIAAFRRGLEEGADAIELDVFLSKDNNPIIIHDNELNRNVSGARRKAQKEGEEGYLGVVRDYTVENLKYFDMGNGNKIPILQEVIEFTALFNKFRIKDGKNPIILNIEFKDDLDSVKYTIDAILKSAEEKKIEKENFIYCSFMHDLLTYAMECDKDANVAMALKTVFLFGKDNVDTNNGWVVEPGIKYLDSAIDELDQKIYEMKKTGKLVALDAVLWDIDPALIDLAVKHNIDVHASTSDFRNFNNIIFIGNLVKMLEKVQVFFKTDEPKKIQHMLHEAYNTHKTELPNPGINNSPSKTFNFSNIKVFTAESYLQPPIFSRLAKPNQVVSEEINNSIIKNFSEKLANFVKERNEKLNLFQEFLEQTQEPILDLGILDELTHQEALIYWDLS